MNSKRRFVAEGFILCRDSDFRAAQVCIHKYYYATVGWIHP